MRVDVIVYGSIFLDVVIEYRSEYVPAANNVYSGKSCPGGGGLNVAFHLSRLGIKTSIVAPLGGDFLGKSLLEYTTSNGIVFLGKVLQSASTGIVVVLVHSNGERSFLVVPGEGLSLSTVDAISPIIETGPRYVFLHGYWLDMPGLSHLAEDVLRTAKKQGTVVFFDPGAYNIVEKYRERIVENLLPYTDIVSPNLEEARALTGMVDAVEAAKSIASMGPRIVAVKMGEKGSLIYQKGGDYFTVEAVKPRGFVNSLGAGDAYDAGLLAGLYSGLALEEAARLASKLASRVVACTCAHC